MFRSLIEQQKRTILLVQSIQDVQAMLENEAQMFHAACEYLLHQREVEGVNVHKRDEDINAGERMVRRAILEHLTLNPKQDLPGSLVLLTVVIYVERIGDYTKELWQLRERGDVAFEATYAERLEEIQQQIQPMFQWCVEAIRDDNAESGNQVMVRKREIERLEDALLEALLKDETLKGPQGIVCALAGRYMRRISAHLSNIASSVVAPLDKIGFDEEG